MELTSKLAYSGKVFIDGNAVSASGKFAIDGTATKAILRLAKLGKPDLTLSIALDFANGTDQLTGTISQGSDWTATLEGDRWTWGITNVPTVYTNNYTFVVPPVHSDPADGPVGHGYGLLTLDAVGKAKISGGAADGHLLKHSTTLSKSGVIPYFVPMYTKERVFNTKTLKETHGLMMGWINLSPNAPAGKVNLAPQGPITWIKTGWTNVYPEGFTNEVDLIGSGNRVPAGTRIINKTSGSMTLDDGNLDAPIIVGFNISTNNTFSTNTLNPRKVTLSASGKTGAMKGAFMHPAIPSVTTKYFGVFLQDYNYGRGYFVGTNESGSVNFQ